MKTTNIVAIGFSCLLSSAAMAAGDSSMASQMLAQNATDRGTVEQRSTTSESMHDSTHTQDKSVLDHERREDKDLTNGSGTDGTDAKSTGSGTTSESIPDNIPPARSE